MNGESNNVEKQKKCSSIGSERDLDNLNDLNSVGSVAGDFGNMSWPGGDRPQEFSPSDSQYPLRPGSELPPHHPKHGRDRRKKKQKESEATWNIDTSNGKDQRPHSPNSDKLNKDVEPLPEPQTDVPVFSVASGSAEQLPPYNRNSSYDNMFQNLSDNDPASENIRASGNAPFKRRSSSKKKRKRHSRRGAGEPSESSQEPQQPPSPAFYTTDIPLTSKMASSSLDSVVRNTLVAKPDVRGDTLGIEQDIENDYFRKRKESTNSNFTKSEDGHTSELNDSLQIGPLTQDVIKSIQRTQSRMKLGHKHSTKVMNQSETARFVVNNINQRECCKFVGAPGPSSDKCACGRLKQWHTERKLPIETKESAVWHQKTHTVTEPCDSFGEIHFRGFGCSVANSPYARVDHKTSPSIVWELLIDYWRLPKPRLLISVTGGAKRFELKPRLSTLLKQGLVGAALNTGAWIITGGTATGVMEFVGEALRDHMTIVGRGVDQCVSLGIATWGCVANKLALDGEGDDGLWPATYAIEDVINPPRGFSSLDANHTHFLLVDNGCEGQFGREISFRSELEKFISEVGTTGVSETQVIHTPAVLIVVEGGVGTMETVFQSIKRNTPVVVINGSGRAADFISLAYKITRDKANPDQTKMPSDFETTLKLAADRTFVWKAHDTNKNKKIQECVDYAKKCLKKRNLINVFNLEKSDSAKDIDRAILFALLKANKFNCKSQLALALAWNRCDIARQQIFTPENRSNWEIKDLYDAMFTALVQNNTDFVQLFLDNGVDLKKFLTIRTLWNLYCNCLSVKDDGEASILRHMITYVKQGWGSYLRCQSPAEWKDFPKENILHCVNKVIIHLLKDETFKLYPKRYCVENEKYTMEWKGDMTTIQPLLSRISSRSQSGFTSDQNRGKLDEKISNNCCHPCKISPQEDHEMEGQNIPTYKELYHPDFDARGTHISRNKRLKQKIKMKENFDFEYPERDLFIFAILFNRRKMAQLFLRQGIDPVATSLVGCSLLKALSDKADMDEETSISLDLLDHAQEMQHFSVSVLNECYQRNKLDSHLILTREIKQLGSMTALAMADRQELMDFAAHSACQTKLSSLWKGSLTLYTSELKILMTTLFPPLIFFMKFDNTYRSKYFDNGNEQEEDTLETYRSIRSEKGNKVDAISTPRFAQSKNLVKDSTKVTNFKEVRVCSCAGEKGINLFRAFYKFYKAPVTKFIANIQAYLVYLALFSYFLLTNFNPVSEEDSPSTVEYVVWLWVFSMICEETRQVFMVDQRSFKYKIRNWWSNFWNQFDFITYLGVIVSIILRYQLSESRFVYVRVMYSLTLAMSYLRLMQYFFAEKNMGPKVIMIRKMLTDLMFFFLILLVFILSFGVAYHVNMFPNSPVDWSILTRVLFYPYFQIYGELFIEPLQGQDDGDCTRNETIWRNDPDKRCPEENAIVLVLLAMYMVLTNILLVNLLIAMFSYTFQTVQENSTKVWRYNRISLVFEYYDRPSLVPPFILINHIWRVIRMVLFMKNKLGRRGQAFGTDLPDDIYHRLTLFEKSAMEVHLANSSLRDREQLDKRVATTAERLEMVMDDLQRIKEVVQQQETEREESNAQSLVPVSKEGTECIEGLTQPVGDPNAGISDSLQTHIRDLQNQASQNTLKLEEVKTLLGQMMNRKQDK